MFLIVLLILPGTVLSSLPGGPLCTYGQVWSQLHIPAGGSVGLQLSGTGDQLDILCLSGFIWDAYSGHPGRQLNVYQDATLIAEISNRVNTTVDAGPFALKGSNPTGTWRLQFINKNAFWNADFTLTIWSTVTLSNTCPMCGGNISGMTGPNCDQLCSPSCYSCCQNDPNHCTVCAVGKSGPPDCSFSCPTQCVLCDNGGGCLVCKDATKSVPNCGYCPPTPCQNPSFTSPCTTKCGNFYPWCETCRASIDLLGTGLSVASKTYEGPEAAKTAVLAFLDVACFAAGIELPFLFPIACDFGVAALEQQGKAIVIWAFAEAAQYFVGSTGCIGAGYCPPSDAPGDKYLGMNTTITNMSRVTPAPSEAVRKLLARDRPVARQRP